MKRIRMLLISLLIVAGLLVSCKDSFLEQLPMGAYAESQLLTPDGMNGFLVGIYSLLNGTNGLVTTPEGQVFSMIRSDETFKGSTAGDQPAFLEFANFNVTTGNRSVLSMWRYNFDAVARCNNLLKLLPDAEGLSDAEKIQIEAETRFLRGHYYFYLKRAFKNIPWIDETVSDVRVPNTVDNDGITYVNCWPQITADFEFAAANLPDTQYEVARPNSWAAKSYLAKILIWRACEGEHESGFAEALEILNDVMLNGKTMSGEPYALVSNFWDNFDPLTENNSESVWAVQCSVNDGTPNGTNGNMSVQWTSTQNSAGPGWGRGIGFVTPTPWYADQFRTDANGLPYLDFFATNPTRLKHDYGLSPAPTSGPDPFVVDTVGVDPRLDWTISRRGIPLLDYGDFPGSSWIREQATDGPYILKKYWVPKSSDGVLSYPGRAYTANNPIIIRYSDVLLLAAECEARVGSLDNARSLVNQVRQRMIDNSDNDRNWVKRADGTNAANYRIDIYPIGGPNDPFSDRISALNAILFERGLEFGTEGHRFWDVTRFGRGEDIFNLYVETEKETYTLIKNANYVDAIDRYLPIPQEAIDNSRLGGVNTLTQNPGY